MQTQDDLKDRILFILVAVYAFTALLSTAASYIVETLGLIILLLSYSKWREIYRNNRYLFLGVGAYLLGHIITTLTAVNKTLAWQTTNGQLEPMLLLFMVLAVGWNERRIAIIMALFAAGFLCNEVYAFYQWIFLHHDRPSGFARQSAVLFAEYIGLTLPLFYLFFLDANRKKVTIVSVVLLVFTSVLMIANSVKMIWIVTTIALGFVTLVSLYATRGKCNLRRMSLFPILLLLMFAVFSFSPIVQERVSTMANAPSSYMHQRFVLWDLGQRIFNDHIIAGVGPGNYGPIKFIYFDKVYPEEIFDRQLINSHNILVQTAAEQGLVGLVALSILVISILLITKILWQQRKFMFSIGIITLLGSLLLAGMAEYTMGYKPLMRTFWFLLGTLIVFARLDAVTFLKGAHERE